MWGQLSIVMGWSRPKQSMHPDPHQRATELIKEFTSRATGHTLPDHVIELQNILRPLREDIINKASKIPDPVYDHPFTATELTRAVQEGRETTPGSDGIRLSHLTHMGTAASAALLDLVNNIYSTHRLPSIWKRAEIVPIPKPHDPQGVCSISLLKVTSKVMERMAKPRFKHAIGDILSCIFGFTDKVGTREALATTISEVSSAIRDCNMAVIVVFLDLHKAFKTCSREAILELQVRKGVQGHLLAYAN